MAARADRWAVRVRREAVEAGSAVALPESRSGKAAQTQTSAAEVMGTVAEALQAAAKAVRREAKALMASARELQFEARSALQGIAGLRYRIARNGLARLIACLLKEREAQREGLAASFNRLVRVLAEFATSPWNWRVLACGVAVLAAVVHGFVVRVNDPIMNVALSGVSEDVWTLVYVGLGAMVFLASALNAKEYSIGKRAEESLLYWDKKAKRSGTESNRPLSLLAGLKRDSRWAVFWYLFLLLVVVWSATSGSGPVPGPALNALQNPAPPPWNPDVLGVLTLDHAILLTLVVAFVLPAVWVLWHLKQVPQDGS